MSLSLSARAGRLLAGLEGGLNKIMTIWLLLAMSACSMRVGLATMGGGETGVGTAFPYILVTVAPLLSISFALKWFADTDRMSARQVRFDPVGKWQAVSLDEAKAHPLYGPNGFMVSLLIGILLNVPVRLAEYLVAIPAIPADVPAWLSTLHLLMTADVVIMTSLYTVVFVAALKRAPIFPMLLMSVWAFDLAMQLVIAELVTAEGLPVAVAEPLHALLEGNVKKVLISVGLWLPYLILSQRVNVTYRRRIAA
ncbi:DUF2569 domain-containing protein [Sphingomicrobium clamense]|uniref:DUF2569 domain-containing protein n=1 Tax=Sphingomicrobium clamense TaxID=2851013 RepID=A0ABS6V4N8_9SPHN|nr:DUF2569 domain-containing protein [Sphingomicrobium sp. B8]MBW0144053.1 DUF2569 domain-containing protein [Sphingomicrobium sp. B8]